MKATDRQVGGNHYQNMAIQPVNFIMSNQIPYAEACAIKYLCRWRNKGGLQDLEKAKQYIDFIIEGENAKEKTADDSSGS